MDLARQRSSQPHSLPVQVGNGNQNSSVIWKARCVNPPNHILTSTWSWSGFPLTSHFIMFDGWSYRIVQREYTNSKVSEHEQVIIWAGQRISSSSISNMLTCFNQSCSWHGVAPITSSFGIRQGRITSVGACQWGTVWTHVFGSKKTCIFGVDPKNEASIIQRQIKLDLCDKQWQ